MVAKDGWTFTSKSGDEQTQTMLHEILNEISEAIFPSNIYCEICGALIDRSRPYSLCDECVRKMHWITGRTCVSCGKALPDTFRGHECYDCMEQEHNFVRGWSCLTYGFHERELMMGIKYSGKGYLAVKMGDVLFDKMEPMIREAGEQGIKLFDLVIPVPVSQSRLAGRGYNQSELMARQMVCRWRENFRHQERFRYRDRMSCDLTGTPGSVSEPPVLRTNILTRQKETEMLRSMNPAERRLALKGAFGVKSGAGRKNSTVSGKMNGVSEELNGKTILLVDDIYTTGATADACSRVLTENGAEAVYLLTLCSGGNRKPDGE